MDLRRRFRLPAITKLLAEVSDLKEEKAKMANALREKQNIINEQRRENRRLKRRLK